MLGGPLYTTTQQVKGKVLLNSTLMQHKVKENIQSLTHSCMMQVNVLKYSHYSE